MGDLLLEERSFNLKKEIELFCRDFGYSEDKTLIQHLKKARVCITDYYEYIRKVVNMVGNDREHFLIRSSKEASKALESIICVIDFLPQHSYFWFRLIEIKRLNFQLSNEVLWRIQSENRGEQVAT